ncbi:MAG: helix-turn-helix transcriptional regulator, partial [Mesorhizobium sp.]
MPKSLRSPRHQRFLAQLISLRNAKGMTQEQVAEKLGRPQPLVAKYEGGERRLDVVVAPTIIAGAGGAREA